MEKNEICNYTQLSMDDPCINYLFNGDHHQTLSYKEWLKITHNKRSFVLRELYTYRFGWTILTTEFIELLSSYLLPYKVLDAGCGSGYLCTLLNDRNISIVGYDEQNCKETAYDFDETIKKFPIINKNYLDADIENFDVVILSWPNYDENHSLQLLDKLEKNQILIYNGESRGGCNATDEFFEKLDDSFTQDFELAIKLNQVSQRFDGIHDYWNVYKKVK